MPNVKQWSDPHIFIPDDPGGRETVTQQLEDYSQTESLVGRIIANKYKVTELLGQGGMALVYKASLADGSPVAVKTLKYHQPDLESRFALEISIHTQLKHPNIVEPIEVLKDPDTGLNLFVMEYLEGLNLEDLLVRYKKLNSVSDISIVLSQILDALEFAHFNGIIHRDLKPENIIIGKQNGQHQVKVLDFGLAKIEEDLQKLTKTGVVLGSPLYMSPEQCMGNELDSRTDLYSFGVLAYELITGSPPYLSDDPMELMKNHCTPLITPPDMASHRDDLPGIDSINNIIQKVLKSEKEQRHSDVYELKEEFTEWWCNATNSDGSIETPFKIVTDKSQAKAEVEKGLKSMEDANALDALVKSQIDLEKKSLSEKVEVASQSRFRESRSFPVKQILVGILAIFAVIGIGLFVVTMSNNQSENADSKSENITQEEKKESDTEKSRSDEVSGTASQTSSSKEPVSEPKPKPKSNRRVVAPPGVYRGR